MPNFELVENPAYRDNFKDGFDTTERYLHNLTQGLGLQLWEFVVAAIFATLCTTLAGLLTSYNMIIVFVTTLVFGTFIMVLVSQHNFDDKKMQTWAGDKVLRRPLQRREIINGRRVGLGSVTRTRGQIGYLLPHEYDD